MPAHEATLMAVVAERHGGVLLPLIDVVGATGGGALQTEQGRLLTRARCLRSAALSLLFTR